MTEFGRPSKPSPGPLLLPISLVVRGRCLPRGVVSLACLGNARGVTKAEKLRGHLDGLLLGALSVGPAHGYALIATLRERSGGVFDLPEGTVYPALHRLERAGLVSSDWAPGPKRRRRVYGLTATGRRELAAQRRTWSSFARAVSLVLGGAEGGA